MIARVFQPFKRVWTPRTPDSSYDSLGPYPPLQSIVSAGWIGDSMGTGVTLIQAIYYAGTAATQMGEPIGTGVALIAASYTGP